MRGQRKKYCNNNNNNNKSFLYSAYPDKPAQGASQLLYPPNSGSEDSMDLASSRRRVRVRVRRRDFLVNALQVRVLVRSFSNLV